MQHTRIAYTSTHVLKPPLPVLFPCLSLHFIPFIASVMCSMWPVSDIPPSFVVLVTQLPPFILPDLSLSPSLPLSLFLSHHYTNITAPTMQYCLWELNESPQICKKRSYRSELTVLYCCDLFIRFYSGIFPCFLHGLSTAFLPGLVLKSSRSSHILFLVFGGSKISSMKPLWAATKGLANLNNKMR